MEYEVKNFTKGLITRVEDDSLPKGAAADSLNWLSRGDRIELRRGSLLMGTRQTGNGRISGLKVATRIDGTEVPFGSYGRKIFAYDGSAWNEAGTNILAADAENEDLSIELYHSLAGAFVYASSPNSSIVKIPVSHPTNAVDQLSTTHRGRIRIKQGRMFLWDRKDTNGGTDKTGLYRSKIDRDELSDYTAVTAEAIGASGSTNYTGTLAFKAAGSKRTCHYVSFTANTAAGSEVFQDDRNGNLTSNRGGTGTINYATGAYDITFAGTTTGAVTSDYYWEDATSSGICDFSKATPRAAGEGFVIRQDDGGGDMMNLGSIGSKEYCFHERKTYEFSVSVDDTQATNQIYRDKVGIPYFRAMSETGDGTLYLDNTDQQNPAVRILTYDQLGQQIVPKSLSDQIDLSDYRFEKAVLFTWGDYDCLACRHKDADANQTLFVRNRLWNAWDRLDYCVSCLDTYGGSLISGDSLSNNFLTLFSGVDDDGSEIPNFWTSGKTDLGVSGLKKAHRMLLEGLIGPDQSLEVYLSFDSGQTFSLVKTITGQDSFVSRQSVAVGANTLGSKEIGGGSTDGDITANHFQIDFGVHTDRFEYIQVKFKATGLGWLSISRYKLYDIRRKGQKSIPSYTA
jgi:hypothetical protein